MNLNTLKVISLVLDLICAVLLTATILFQSGKSAGLSGAIAGASDSFMAKGGSKTLDAKLAKATKWIGLAFVVLSLVTTILITASASVQ
ncbi:MAG: preprotein translocase subunit SecG [Oscillospiraceae bacterium]|nr:preprotein translocase subunit SecG [Oscillospiraceae bacterium]